FAGRAKPPRRPSRNSWRGRTACKCYSSTVLSGRGLKTRSTVLLRVGLFLILLFLFAVSTVAFRADSLFDSLADLLARTAYTFTQFLTCCDGLPLLNLVAGLFAALSNLFAGAFKTAAD